MASPTRGGARPHRSTAVRRVYPTDLEGSTEAVAAEKPVLPYLPDLGMTYLRFLRFFYPKVWIYAPGYASKLKSS